MQSLLVLIVLAQLTTGRAHDVLAPSGSLERTMPSDLAYGRGLELVKRGAYVEAAVTFQAARGEFLRMLQDGRVDAVRGQSWVACATKRLAESVQLERVREQLGRDDADLHMRAHLALLLHNGWLAAGAYFGRPDRALGAEVERAYRAALDGVKQDDAQLKQARIAYAGFLGAAGRPKEGFAQLTRATSNSDTEPTEILAYARLALGDKREALRVLARLRHETDWAQMRERILLSNDFDSVRRDPEFIRIVGGAH